jgi:hypothetical protein
VQLVAGFATLTPPQTGLPSRPWVLLVPSTTSVVAPAEMVDGDVWKDGPVREPVDADAGDIPYVNAAIRNRNRGMTANQDFVAFNWRKFYFLDYICSEVPIHEDEFTIHIFAVS